MAKAELNFGELGGGGNVLEGIVYTKQTYTYCLGFNDTTSSVYDDFTGNYIKSTYANNSFTVSAIADCKVYSKMADGTTDTANYSNGDTIATISTSSISNYTGVAFIVIG